MGLAGRCAMALMAVTTVGCSDGGETAPVGAPGDQLLAPPAEGEGLQYRLATTVEAGAEVEHCRFVQAPAEGLWVNRDLVRYSEGSHHFILFETSYDAIPTENDDGEPVDTTKVFDCSEGPSADWSIRRVIGGAQNFAGDPALQFPPHVGLHVPGGAILLMNAHYINTNPEPLDAEVRINLYTIPEDQVQEEGDLLFWYNIFIRVDEMAAGRATMRCDIPDDITLVNAQSHMHARGVDFEAHVVGGDSLYVTDEWEDVPVKLFGDGQGIPIPGGSQIEYRCDYESAETRTIYQGPRSSDEMCMFIGSYYPADRATSLCSADEEEPLETQFLGAEWVGNGDKSCAEAAQCGYVAPDFETLTDCVLSAKPEVAKEVSELLVCDALRGETALDEACKAELEACFDG
ncbi:MAG: hypothetical protein RIF41_21825 [Polyangiaceae bacterium]